VTEPLGFLRTPGRELARRHARREGRSIARLRAIDYGDSCVVEAEVYPAATGGVPTQAGPYRFPSAREATAFLEEAVEALTFLGCDIETASA
jgi:hypothetical protein